MADDEFLAALCFDIDRDFFVSHVEVEVKKRLGKVNNKVTFEVIFIYKFYKGK